MSQRLTLAVERTDTTLLALPPLTNALPEACERFCNCIYKKGDPLDRCLDEYGKKKE